MVLVMKNNGKKHNYRFSKNNIIEKILSGCMRLGEIILFPYDVYIVSDNIIFFTTTHLALILGLVYLSKHGIPSLLLSVISILIYFHVLRLVVSIIVYILVYIEDRAIIKMIEDKKRHVGN